MRKVTNEIKEACNKLKEINTDEPKKLDLTALKDLRKFCNVQIFKTNDKHERVISFFIENYLNEIFNNLFIDTKYNQRLHESRIVIYKNITSNLSKLEIACNDKDVDKIFKTMDKIIKGYVDQINYLNNLHQIF